MKKHTIKSINQNAGRNKQEESGIKKKIYGDGFKAMCIPILLHTAVACAEGVLTVFTAAILGQFADSVFRLDLSLGVENAVYLGLALFAMIALLPVLGLVANMFMLKYALVHDRMILGRFLDKKYDSLLRYELGDIQNRLDWDPTDLRCYLVLFFEKGVMVPVTLTFLLYHALKLSPLYTVIVFVLSLLKLIVPVAVKKLEGRYEKEGREYASRRRSLETEFTEHPCMVKLYGLREAYMEKAEKLYRAYFLKTESKSIVLSKTAEAAASFAETFCLLAILFTGALLASEGLITLGCVAAMYGYFAVFGTLLDNIGYLVRKIPVFKNITERLTLFYEEAEETPAQEADPVCAAANTLNKAMDIRCEGLSYAYGEQQVLSQVSFSVHAGEKIALCGANGSGKSTLMKVLLGLLTNYGGRICVDGRELREVNLAAYRGRIAYAPQDPYLFEGTVEENIRIGRWDMPKEEMEDILEKLGLVALAGRLVGNGGSGLSGGEKQKISIARALAKNVEFLFLDEPGNNLDKDSLDWLHAFVRESDKTIVFVSHEEAFAACAHKKVMLPG